MSVTTTAPFGAVPLEPGVAGFRVWAPRARSVAVRLDGREHELREAEGGLWEGELAAEPGDDYRFAVDRADAWPDPCSRWQPQGVRGPSRLLEPARFEIAEGPGLRLEELVLYELHVGTFSAEGTFDGVVPRLAALRELGVTAVELMPVATFPAGAAGATTGSTRRPRTPPTAARPGSPVSSMPHTARASASSSTSSTTTSAPAARR